FQVRASASPRRAAGSRQPDRMPPDGTPRGARPSTGFRWFSGVGIVAIDPVGAPALLALPRLRIETRDQMRGGDHAVGLGDELRDGRPVRLSVDTDRDPALVPDVRRPEVPFRILLDEGLLHARTRGQPDRDVLGPVMMRLHLREHLPGPPRWLAPRNLLGRL